MSNAATTRVLFTTSGTRWLPGLMCLVGACGSSAADQQHEQSHIVCPPCGMPGGPVVLDVTDTATGLPAVDVTLENVTGPSSGAVLSDYCATPYCEIRGDGPGVYTFDVVTPYCDTMHMTVDVPATPYNPDPCCRVAYVPQSLDVALTCHPEPLPHFDADPACPADKVVEFAGAVADLYLLYFVHAVSGAQADQLATLLRENYGVVTPGTPVATPFGYSLFLRGTESQARAVAAESAVCFVESYRAAP